MQVYRSRVDGVAPFPLAYYLDNKAPISSPGGAQTVAAASVDAEHTKLQGFTFFECLNFEQGFPVLATFLLSGLDPNVTTKDAVGASGVHYAAKTGNLLAINFLLDNGANVNARTRGGQTPLMWAVSKNQLDAASLLFRRGADASCVDDEGNSVVSFALDHPVAMNFLRGNPLVDVVAIAAKEKLLHRLCKTPGSRFAVLYCIEQLGLSVNEKDIASKTPLHYAAVAGDIDVVKALCAKGADLGPHVVDERGQRPETQAGVSSAIRTFLQRYEAEASKTGKDRLTTPDFSNLSRLDVKQLKHFAVAFTVPNIIIFIGSLLPTLLGLLCMALCAIGFTMVAQFGMAQRGRSLATAGWFSGALCFGGTIVVRQTMASYTEERPESIVPFVWYFVTVTMFYCYARAVLADPGVVQSSADGRKEIYELLAQGGESAVQAEGIDMTSMVRKPLRSKHCTKTGQCVYRFDHYCVWTGNAIGGGNHRYFVLYCMFQFASQMLVAYTTVVYLFGDAPRRANITSIFSSEFGAFMFNADNTLVTFLLVFYNSFVFLFVSSVLVGQLWFATRNVTSNEVWFAERYKWMFKLGTRAYSHFDHGWKANLIEFFWSGNLCAEMHTVPPMNDYLKGLCQRYAAAERSRQLNQQAGYPQHGPGLVEEGAAANNVGGFNYAQAVSQLPENVQQEMRIVQSMLQKMVSQGSPDGVDVPADVPEDRREHVMNQARTMFQHFQTALQMNRQASSGGQQQLLQPPSDERVSLLSDAVDVADDRPSTAVVDVGPSGKRGRKAD